MPALILAGGLGTRLRPIVDDKPKPMAGVNGKPFLEHQLAFLQRFGLSHFVLCVGYRRQQIQEYFKDGSPWGVRIDYAVEEQPLGTAGALKNAQAFVDGPFLVLNGDSFFDADLHHLLRFHDKARQTERGYMGTIALTRVPDAEAYGTVHLEPQSSRIVKFAEKAASTARSAQSRYINAGIYVLEPDVLQRIPANEKVSIERDVFPQLLNDAQLYGCYLQGFFVDIGTPEGYREFQGYLKEQER
ncbi:MAG: nucleotidyltransferase family protein [Chloroflexota bacterium]